MLVFNPKALDKTLYTFASTTYLLSLKQIEAIAEAVYFPIPGSLIKHSNFLGNFFLP